MTGPAGGLSITSESGTFSYTLGEDFEARHIAATRDDAEAKARRLYDPDHEDGHSAAVTVVVRNSLMRVTRAADVPAKGVYHWSLMIENVEAVMMGPSGRAGANGDPGQLDRNVTGVVVSGYSTGATSGKITHVAASQ